MTDESMSNNSDIRARDEDSRLDPEHAQSGRGRHRLAVIVACAAILAAVVGGCHALLGGIVDQPDNTKVLR